MVALSSDPDSVLIFERKPARHPLEIPAALAILEFLIAVVCFPALDDGRSGNQCFFTACGFWLVAAWIFLRRGRSATRGDRRFIALGYLAMLGIVVILHDATRGHYLPIRDFTLPGSI